MAQNTNIDVNVNVNDEQVGQSEEKFKSLRRQIRETTVQLQELTDKGETQGKKFSELNLKLAELRTEAEQVNNKTQSLTSTFQLMGGAVGEFGDKAEVGIQALKTISSFTLKDIQNQFAVVGQELKTFVTKIIDASGISKAYAATNAYLAESFVAVGVSEEAAAVGAKAFSTAIIATGIGAIIVGLVLLYQNWDKVEDAMTGATEATKLYDAAIEKTGKDIEKFYENLISTRQSLEAAEKGLISKKEALKIYNDTLGESLGKVKTFEEAEKRANSPEAVKAYLDALVKKAEGQILLQKAAQAAADAATGKAGDLSWWQQAKAAVLGMGNATVAVGLGMEYMNDNIKDNKKEVDDLTEAYGKLQPKGATPKPTPTPKPDKSVDEAKKVQAELNKIAEDDYAKTLSDRDRELYIAGGKYNELLIKAKHYHIDTTALTEGYEMQKTTINNKFNEIDKKKAEEKAAKDLQLSKQTAAENLQYTKDYLTKQSAELQKSYGDDYETKVQYYEDNKKLLAKQIDDLDTFLENGYITQQQYDALKEQNRKDRIANEKKEAVTVEGIITKSYDNRETLIKEKFGKFAIFQKAYWDAEKASLQKSVDDNEKAYKDKKITEDTYLANKKKNADAAIKIDEGEQKSKELTLSVIADAFNNLSIIAGKQTEAGKAFAVAGATISTYESATKAYDALSGIPIVGPALGAIAAAAAVVAGLENVKQIMSVDTGGGGSGASAGAAPGIESTKGYGEGGILEGPRHAAGGMMINAEGGEAIMTRGAVSMFGPLLSQLNKAGGGTSFTKGASGAARNDNPKSVTNPSSEPTIIKTYVVAQDMNTMNHKQARLKDLSTL